MSEGMLGVKKTAAGKLQMTMMAAIAEFERAMILERQKEGIANELGISRGTLDKLFREYENSK